MGQRVRPYLFYDIALTICSTCFRKLEGKIVFENGNVLLVEALPRSRTRKNPRWPTTWIITGGAAKSLSNRRKCRLDTTPLYDGVARMTADFAPTMSSTRASRWWKSAMPAICAAQYVTPEAARRGRSIVLSNKSKECWTRSCETKTHPDVVQISGGEPTLHPEFFKVLDLAKARPIRHLMINTNGVRIAQEEIVRRAAG